MKKLLLFGVTILLSSNSFGQLIEVSLKGGVCKNNLAPKLGELKVPAKDVLGYGGGLSGTVGFGSLRTGLSISAYRVCTSIRDVNGPNNSRYSLGNPVVPLEAMLLKRFRISNAVIDAGAMGGICANARYVSSYDNGLPTTTTTAKKNWFTYGLILGGQYKISDAISVGVELQPKWISMGIQQIFDNTFLLPVMAKVSAQL